MDAVPLASRKRKGKTKAKIRASALKKHETFLGARTSYIHMKRILGLIDGQTRPAILHAIDWEGLDNELEPQGSRGLLAPDLWKLGVKREFGITILGTRDISMTPEHSEAYARHVYSKVQVHFLLLDEFSETWNVITGKEHYRGPHDPARRQVPLSFRFRQQGSEVKVALDGWKAEIARLARRKERNAEVEHIALEHRGRDFEVLRQHGVSTEFYDMFMDSMDLVECVRGKTGGCKLRNCMHWLGENYSWIHNAGNDAMFCLQVAVKTACLTEAQAQDLGKLAWGDGVESGSVSWAKSESWGLKRLWDERLRPKFVHPTLEEQIEAGKAEQAEDEDEE